MIHFIQTSMPMKRNVIPGFFMLVSLFVFAVNAANPDTNSNTVTDIDGNVYHTVTIGAQIWTVENLKTTKYNDGTPIPLVTDSADWSLRTTPGYCWYCNDTNIAKKTYGALYNWFAVNTGKLAPPGWHVPTDAEWCELAAYLGGEGVAGGALKDTGVSCWLSPNAGATNQTGFSARPGGGRGCDGGFYGMGRRGHWWTATAYYASNSSRRSLYADFASMERTYNDNSCGYSVRLVKDCIGEKPATGKNQTIQHTSEDSSKNNWSKSVKNTRDTYSDKIKTSNLRVPPKITLDDTITAFDSLPLSQQDIVNKIWMNYGDYIEINLCSINKNTVMNNTVRIHSITTDTVFSLLNATNMTENDNNAKITDTIIMKKVINHCQKIFHDAGYPQIKNYSFKLDNITSSGLNDSNSMIHFDLNFNESYKGIKIENSSAGICIFNGSIESIAIHSFASSNMKVTTSKPKLSLSRAIQIYRDKKHLPLTAHISPTSRDGDTINNLRYLPGKANTEMRLCWALYLSIDHGVETDWVDAETGDIIAGGALVSFTSGL